MPTQAERLAVLEERQKNHEDKMSTEIMNMSTAIDKATETAQEAKDLATQVSGSVEALPAKIIEGIEKKRKENRMEGKDWVLFGFSALTILAMFGEKLGLFK